MYFTDFTRLVKENNGGCGASYAVRCVQERWKTP